MTEYSGLTWHERLLKCRELAEDARIAAEDAGTRHARDRYLIIAAQWEGIVADIERRLGLIKGPVRPRVSHRVGEPCSSASTPEESTAAPAQGAL